MAAPLEEKALEKPGFAAPSATQFNIPAPRACE
jgi:hypothetical protein